MNSSTASNSIAFVERLTQALTYTDLAVRCIAGTCFLVYFSILALRRDWQARPLFHLHQVNLVNFIYVLIYLGFFDATMPASKWPILNKVVCTGVEALFGLLKFLRPFSLLLLFVNQYVAEYFVPVSKYLNRSQRAFYVPFAFVWVLSIVASLSAKFGFKTTYYPLMCTDGYATAPSYMLGYMLFTTIAGILFPIASMSFLFYRIRIRTADSSDSPEPTHSDSADQQRDAKQTAIVYFWSVITLTIAFVQSFRYIIPGFNTSLFYVRLLLRVINLLSIAFLPVLSIYFNPAIAIRGAKVCILAKYQNPFLK